mmetsp:Transcript_27972/g.70772  ORF Transcript_27972/g.70772 Transcript_27972/m.70772 type:complete len:233 (-) Transcript_27972:1955-2653(-)
MFRSVGFSTSREYLPVGFSMLKNMALLVACRTARCSDGCGNRFTSCMASDRCTVGYSVFTMNWVSSGAFSMKYCTWHSLNRTSKAIPSRSIDFSRSDCSAWYTTARGTKRSSVAFNLLYSRRDVGCPPMGAPSFLGDMRECSSAFPPPPFSFFCASWNGLSSSTNRNLSRPLGAANSYTRPRSLDFSAIGRPQLEPSRDISSKLASFVLKYHAQRCKSFKTARSLGMSMRRT